MEMRMVAMRLSFHYVLVAWGAKLNEAEVLEQ